MHLQWLYQTLLIYTVIKLIDSNIRGKTIDYFTFGLVLGWIVIFLIWFVLYVIPKGF